MMLIACLCYEPRERTEFYRTYNSHHINDLKKKIRDNPHLNRYKRFNCLETLTAMIHPCYYGKTIFDIMRNTNLPEGDVIRFFRQVLDRIGQIKKATEDGRLGAMLENCQHLITDSMKDIDVV